MTDLKENGSVIISGHILIRDTETKEILLNKSESSLINNAHNKKGDTKDER